jgi:tripeptide aminopeptidase
MIDVDRITDEFAHLAAINSPPLKERQIAEYLCERFERLGAEVLFDGAAAATGGEVGNLIARFSGTGKKSEPLILSVHMDTVEPGGDVVPQLKHGVFTSAGETILGADDKAGIAEIIEALEVLHEQKIPHGPLEVVVTIAEEIGLVGAKHLDVSLLKGRRGYALDTTGIECMVLKAPGANRLRIEVTGLAAHAGLAPEDGVSAIQTAGLALSEMRLGRIDEETTANIGKIKGGVAINIIPESVKLEGEARSHDPDKLAAQTEHMVTCFEKAADAMACEIDGKIVRPQVAITVKPDYPSMAVAEDAELVTMVKTAAKEIDMDLKIRLGGGGSDANIFNGHGIEMIILPTGMTDVHTSKESVKVADMVKLAELLVEVIKET